jgi:hypothetical protein
MMVGLLATGCLGGELDPSQPTADQGWSYRYVQDGVVLPTGAAADMQGADLDGNGTPDNKLGRVLGALSNFGLDLQSQADQAIEGGHIIVLHGLIAENLDDDPGAMWQVMLGEGTSDPDFSGDGKFDIAEASPDDARLAGRISQGRFVGGPAPVTVFMAIAEVPITFHLVESHLEGTVTEEGCDLNLAGGILVSEVSSTLVPAAAMIINTFATQNPGSADGMMDVLDLDENGEISAAELKDNPIVSDLLEPDLDLLGGNDGVKDALSMGVGIRCVRATF